eukprot:scaffold162_cov176-Amphora_coffeaeformis.AAC.23
MRMWGRRDDIVGWFYIGLFFDFSRVGRRAASFELLFWDIFRRDVNDRRIVGLEACAKCPRASQNWGVLFFLRHYTPDPRRFEKKNTSNQHRGSIHNLRQQQRDLLPCVITQHFYYNMRSFYLNLAVLALSLNPLEATKGASGLLRERMQDARRTTDAKGKGSDGAGIQSTGSTKGKGSNGTEIQSTATGSSKGKGSDGTSIQSTATGSSKGKGKSPGIQSTTSSNGKGSKEKGLGTNIVPTSTEPKSTGCDCDAPKDSCTENEPGQEVQCFDVISDHRVLKTSLGCPDAEGMGVPPVITVQGPDGVLECSGDGDNLIYDPTPTTSSRSVGVRLIDGGRLVNCHVAGFQTGVEMAGEGDNAIVGSHIFNVQYGIETGVDIGGSDMVLSVGNYSVDCTTITGATNEGIVVRNGGQMIISGTSVLDAHSVGIHYAPRIVAGGLYASLSKVNVFSTNKNDAVGILVGDNFKFMAHDDVYLQIFELSKVIGAGADGFIQSATPHPDNSLPELATEVIGRFDVQASTGSGIYIESGTFTSADGSLVSACTSGVSNDDSMTIPAGVIPDIFVNLKEDPRPSYVNNGTAQCTLSLASNLGCVGRCSDSIDTALACQGAVSSFETQEVPPSKVPPLMGSGKGKGGKGSKAGTGPAAATSTASGKGSKGGVDPAAVATSTASGKGGKGSKGGVDSAAATSTASGKGGKGSKANGGSSNLDIETFASASGKAGGRRRFRR